jgi:hypothetical protein
MGEPPRQGVARRPATGRASFGFCQSLRLRSPRGSSAPLFHRARHVRWWQEVWDGGDGLGPPSGAGCPGLCAPHSGPGSSGFADPPAPRTPGQLRAWWDEGVGAGPRRQGCCDRGPAATLGHGGTCQPPGSFDDRTDQAGSHEVLGPVSIQPLGRSDASPQRAGEGEPKRQVTRAI